MVSKDLIDDIQLKERQRIEDSQVALADDVEDHVGLVLQEVME